MNRLLTSEQEQLLFKLVEYDRELRRQGQPRDVFLGRVMGPNDFILIGSSDIPVDYHDAVQLFRRGFITQTGSDAHGGMNGSVSPEGIQYYENAKSRKPAVEVLALEVITYVDGALPESFGKAARLLREAGDRVWKAEADTDLTEIGHKVREALQEFSDVLVREFAIDSGPIDKTRTRNKVSTVRQALERTLGDADRKLLAAIEHYWDAVVELAQKLEHNSQRDDRPVEIADAKRLVLLAYVSMAELIRLANRAKK